MLTIICNSSNGLYFVYLFAVDHSFHCNLDLETCPDLETCLELVFLPNYIDLSYKTVKTAFKQNYILFTQHFLLDPCAGNIRALNKLYNSTRYFVIISKLK